MCFSGLDVRTRTKYELFGYCLYENTKKIDIKAYVKARSFPAPKYMRGRIEFLCPEPVREAGNTGQEFPGIHQDEVVLQIQKGKYIMHFNEKLLIVRRPLKVS